MRLKLSLSVLVLVGTCYVQPHTAQAGSEPAAGSALRRSQSIDFQIVVPNVLLVSFLEVGSTAASLASYATPTTSGEVPLVSRFAVTNVGEVKITGQPGDDPEALDSARQNTQLAPPAWAADLVHTMGLWRWAYAYSPVAAAQDGAINYAISSP